jgi:hypothetical protein
VRTFFPPSLLALPESVRGAATASYRLLPHIILDDANPVPPQFATRFQDCFSPGVIKVDPRTKKVSVDQRRVRGETMGREVLRHPDFAGYVKLARVRDYFICTLSPLNGERRGTDTRRTAWQLTSNQRGHMNRNAFRSRPSK